MFIRSWDEKSKSILHQLSQNGRAYSHDMPFVRKFASQKGIRELINSNLLDIAHNHKKKKSIFVVPPDIMVIPRPSQRGISFHFKRYKIF